MAAVQGEGGVAARGLAHYWVRELLIRIVQLHGLPTVACAHTHSRTHTRNLCTCAPLAWMHGLNPRAIMLTPTFITWSLKLHLSGECTAWDSPSLLGPTHTHTDTHLLRIQGYSLYFTRTHSEALKAHWLLAIMESCFSGCARPLRLFEQHSVAQWPNAQYSLVVSYSTSSGMLGENQRQHSAWRVIAGLLSHD